MRKQPKPVVVATTACKKQQEPAKDGKHILKYYKCTSRERLIHSVRECVSYTYMHRARIKIQTQGIRNTGIYKKLLKFLSISIFSIFGIFYNNFIFSTLLKCV